MSGFHDEFDSESDSDKDNEIVSWSDEEEEEAPVVVKAAPAVVVPKIDVVKKPPYIVERLDLFFALCELEDWEFEKMPDETQIEIMKTLKIETFTAGDRIIVEGDVGNDCYFVIATEETAHLAEVEVVNQNLVAGTEVFLTRLHRGQYFGQKFFLTRRVNKRGATVRVPYDSTVPVQIAKLTQEHFDKWDTFRNLLLVKTVPLIQKLPRKERSQILQNLQVREFRDNDYIIRQGEKGEDFFIIQEGSVKVVERRPAPDKGPDAFIDVTLVTLREGHFFGEMSLVTDEPRVASVISIKSTICLVLSKSVFRSALSDETFLEVLNDVLSKRKEIRKQREEQEQDSNSVASPGSMGSMSGLRRMSSRSRPSIGSSSEVSVSTTLSMKKLESGTRVVNKYIVERELGKGSFGDVYLCKDQETGEEYAMKMINRPANSWNDEAASSIRQEIAVMKRLKHQNVVGLHEVIDDQSSRKIILIQEFMEGGALMPDAETCDPMDAKTARKYFRDIVRGVCYLHSEGIIHRDIKPQNMLRAADGTVKIADFGAAVFSGGTEKVAFGGTPAFMAPELFMSNAANVGMDFTKSPGIDVFALGATLYYMVVGRPPWMAKNQIDLATKIKNIELTFPVENMDPHLKHLLRQMLAKDYRTRCTLDTILQDDWVTFEGSDPVFEKDDCLINEFVDFAGVQGMADNMGFNPPIKVLIVHQSLVMRTMLHYQIDNVQTAISISVGSSEDALKVMESSIASHPGKNFDYIFCECDLPTRAEGLELMKQFRKIGFTGKIIATTTSTDNLDEFHNGIANMVARRPIGQREMQTFLTTDSTDDCMERNVTAEEFEQAITFHMARTASMHSIKSDLTVDTVETQGIHRSFSKDADDFDDDAGNLQDFDNITSTETAAKEVETITYDLNRLSTSDNKSLVRKRGFMVVAYGAEPESNEPAFMFDRPLKIFSLTEEASRRERRELAMRHSQLAQQHRETHKKGFDRHPGLTSSKSLMNIYKQQSINPKSKTSFFEKKSSKSSIRLSDSPSVHSSSDNSMSGSIQRVNSDVAKLDIPDMAEVSGEDRGSASSEEEVADSDYDGEILDSSDDEGYDAEEIRQLDDFSMDIEFASLTQKKTEDSNQELSEWNHIMVGIDLSHKLRAGANSYSPLLGVKFAMAENMATRTYMEDRSYCNVSVANREDEGRTPLALFAVFDGHSGDYVAQHLKDNYADALAKNLKKMEDNLDKHANNSSFEALMEKIFEDTNMHIDRELFEKDYIRQQKSKNAGIADLTYAGSVSVVATVMPIVQSVKSVYNIKTGVEVFISHVGDCRAVLCCDGQAIQLTEDHKPNNATEKQRIINAGGWVANGRVSGGLAVARSFGDIQFKNFSPCAGFHGDEHHHEKGIWGTSQQVISKPDFYHFVVDDSSYEFMILASDGLWDVFPCQDAVNFVRKKLLVEKDLNKTAELLIQKAIQRGTQDNTSVIICAFNQ